ncbi:sorting nexin 3 [Stylonychia lemnae]|uniref:Sorting nexin 3 n=1 Tax=Stylonychia lemnae TaxID=5949 RepID=A0A078AEZ9_STYLE|nr:sorting nexin 3 [Stylonychia lemnae]|eukprot:CDW80844.1 sorting nexin 3 [Stylonychia lemnae]
MAQENKVGQIKLTKTEKTYYNKLFDKYATPHRSKLNKIYSLAQETEKKYTEKKEFLAALKLIAIQQNFKSLDNKDTLMGSSKVPLIQLEGEEEFEDKRLDNYKVEEQKNPDENQMKSLLKMSQISFGIKSSIHDKLKQILFFQHSIKSKLPKYDPNKVYITQRRFTDFEWLFNQLRSNEFYKGLIVPPLPEKKYLGNMDAQFLEKRREDLDNFLRVVSTHTTIKFDDSLFAFLVSPDIEELKQNPGALQVIIEKIQYIPKLKDMSLSEMSYAIQTTFVGEQIDRFVFEPAELKSDLDLNQHEKEINQLESVLRGIGTSIKLQKELYSQESQQINKIGEIFQKIYNLDDTQKIIDQSMMKETHNFYTGAQFYSDLDVDVDLRLSSMPSEEEKNSQGDDYDHLDNITADTKIRQYFSEFAEIMDNQNPNHQCDIYIRGKVAMLQGILQVLKDRKSYIKSYVSKMQLKVQKQQKLNQSQYDSRHMIELNQEIEFLSKEISEVKQSILNQNINIAIELEKIDSAKVNQLRKIMIAYGKQNFNCIDKLYHHFQSKELD